ncbi:17375_t:CDS:1, partial [Funneliformis caledonium]
KLRTDFTVGKEVNFAGSGSMEEKLNKASNNPDLVSRLIRSST